MCLCTFLKVLETLLKQEADALQAAGVSTVCIYASHLLFRVRKFEPPLVRKPFSIRVMIPCYKEDIETLEETVECAVEAAKAAMTKGQTNAGMVTSCDSSNSACGWMRNLAMVEQAWSGRVWKW